MGLRHDKYRRAWKQAKRAIDYDCGTALTYAFRLCPDKYREVLFVNVVEYLCLDLDESFFAVIALLEERDFDVGARQNRLWRCAVEQVAVSVKELLMDDPRLDREAPEVKAWFLTDTEFEKLYSTAQGQRQLKKFFEYMEKAIQKIKDTSEYVCYFLESCQPRSRCTYVGITNNLKRRLRQHNGEITGGAKYTRRARPWRHFLVVEGFRSKREVLQFEWQIKHKRKGGIGGVSGRVKTLAWHLKQERWLHLSFKSYITKPKHAALLNEFGTRLQRM